MGRPRKDKPVVQAPPRDLLERYLAEKIASLKGGLDEVYEPKEGYSDSGEKLVSLTQLQSLKAYWSICVAETNECLSLFGDCSPSTLHPNHRKIMKMTKHFNDILKKNDIINEESENSYKCMDFARISIDYLTGIHKVLLNDKKWTHKLKDEVYKAFMEWEALDYGTTETKAEV